MTQREVLSTIRFIGSIKRNFKVPEEELEDTVKAWHFILKDYSVEEVQLAVVAFVKSGESQFAPDVGDIIKIIERTKQTERLDKMSAWSLVKKAICNGNYGAEEEFEKLPELVQRAVGNPSNIREWARMKSEDVTNNVQPRFFASFDRAERENNIFKFMPEQYRNQLTQKATSLQIETEKPFEPSIECGISDEIQRKIDEFLKRK